MPKVLGEALDNAGLEAHDVDWLLLHQANIRIMETVASKLGLPMEKVITKPQAPSPKPALHDHRN